jgi:purine-binding chemotaxis protein CheW
MKRGPSPVAGRATDWADIRQRIEAAGRAVAGSGDWSEERARAVLEDRARALARPVTSPAPADELELITFTLANEVYALESRYVLAVFRLEDVAPLPGAAAPVLGLTAWRGDLLTVLDLRPALGLPATALDDLGRVIAVGEERAAFGVLADAVQELVRIPASEVREPPEGVAARRDYLRGVTHGAMLVLDGDRLLRIHA